MIIRPIQPDEAEHYLAMLNTLDRETEMMMFEPGERQESKEDIRSKILQSQIFGSLILVVEDQKRIVGFLAAEKGFANRIRHSAYIVVGILASHRGLGLGRKLFAELDHWAGTQQITKLELTVLAHNQAGIELYKKMGFDIEGTKRQSMRINGQYYDELYMGKILD